MFSKNKILASLDTMVLQSWSFYFSTKSMTKNLDVFDQIIRVFFEAKLYILKGSSNIEGGGARFARAPSFDS